MKNKKIVISIIGLILVFILVLLSFKFIFKNDDNTLFSHEKKEAVSKDIIIGMNETVKNFSEGLRNFDINKMLDQIYLTDKQKEDIKKYLSQQVGEYLPGQSFEDLMNSDLLKGIMKDIIVINKFEVKDIKDSNDNKKTANLVIDMSVMGKNIKETKPINFIPINGRWLFSPEGDYSKFMNGIISK